MRLRPFGASGALVSSFEALEDYLLLHGRDWERYAWVKARALTGAGRYAQLYREVVRPFVYRRYLDFGVFESLREMKALIESEVARREIADKLGKGGIREIEFIVQALQLIRGGSDQRLQDTRLLQVLPRMVGARLLTASAAQELESAYRFLRVLENCLQMRRDEQTHLIPRDAPARAQLARVMRCRSWAELQAQLTQHRGRVAAHFDAVVFAAQPRDSATGAAAGLRGALAALFDQDAPATSLQRALKRAGAADSDTLAATLLELRNSNLLRRLDDVGRQRLQALLPELLADVIAAGPAVAAMRRLLRLLEAIGARSAYFALLRARRGR
jgi:glutamate-ammonia-ligase adenylyltransferase